MYEFTFHDLLLRNLCDRASHPAIVHGETSVSYGELDARSAEAAGFLAERGIGRGDRVVVHLVKSVEEVVAMFAASRLGAVIVNVNCQLRRRQLHHVIDDSGARAAFVEERAAQELAECDVPRSLETVVVNGSAPDRPEMTGWSAIQRGSSVPDPVGIDRDLAALFYTSGSTGLPKGVMVTHANLLAGARSVATYLENHADDRLMSLLPFSFDYGLSQLSTMFLTGGTLVLQPVMMAAEVIRTLAEHRVTGLAGVPSTFVPIVEFLEAAPRDLPDLRYLTNSGGSIPHGTLERLPGVFPGADIFLMYGLTEAFRSTFLPPAEFGEKMGAMGRAVPDAEVFVVGEAGVSVPGAEGELVHRGAFVSAGYWGRPDLTAEVIRPCAELGDRIGDERVCFSGDVVRMDEDGCIWFVGRRDGMIKCSGFRISPTEVEEIVSSSGLVAEVVAFGVPDPLTGEAVAVAASEASDVGLDEKALLAHCRRTMPSYMVPRAVHRIPGKLPLTANGKPDRVRIRRECLQASGGAVASGDQDRSEAT